MRLAGHYTLPLGIVGALGDDLLGHRIAGHAVHGFIEAAAARIEAVFADQLVTTVPASGRPPEVTLEEPHPEMFLG